MNKVSFSWGFLVGWCELWRKKRMSEHHPWINFVGSAEWILLHSFSFFQAAHNNKQHTQNDACRRYNVSLEKQFSPLLPPLSLSHSHSLAKVLLHKHLLTFFLSLLLPSLLYIVSVGCRSSEKPFFFFFSISYKLSFWMESLWASFVPALKTMHCSFSFFSLSLSLSCIPAACKQKSRFMD